MRIGVVSDIHANRQAWKAVQADMEREKVDALVCLGDIVGYGPEPQEVLDAVRAATPDILLGNHDAVIGGLMDSADFNDHARDIIEWTRRQLDPEAGEFFRQTPEIIEGEDALYTHAEAAVPMRFTYVDTPEEARESFAARPEKLIFIGHTHVPGVFALNLEDNSIALRTHRRLHLRPQERYLINVGSVGEPRDGDARSSYVIYDNEAQTVEFRRVTFDVEGYLSDLERRGLQIEPAFLAAYRYQLAHPGEAPRQDGVTLARPQPAMRLNATPPPKRTTPDRAPTRRMIRYSSDSAGKPVQTSASQSRFAATPAKSSGSWRVPVLIALVVLSVVAGVVIHKLGKGGKTKSPANPPPSAAKPALPVAGALPVPAATSELDIVDTSASGPTLPSLTRNSSPYDGLPGDVWLLRPGQSGGPIPGGLVHWNLLNESSNPIASAQWTLMNTSRSHALLASLVSVNGSINGSRSGVKSNDLSLFGHRIPDAVTSGSWSAKSESLGFTLEFARLDPGALYVIAVFFAGDSRPGGSAKEWRVTGAPVPGNSFELANVSGVKQSSPIRPAANGTLQLYFAFKEDGGASGLNVLAIKELSPQTLKNAGLLPATGKP
jgi:predicted phosphodiesterase